MGIMSAMCALISIACFNSKWEDTGGFASWQAPLAQCFCNIHLADDRTSRERRDAPQRFLLVIGGLFGWRCIQGAMCHQAPLKRIKFPNDEDTAPSRLDRVEHFNDAVDIVNATTPGTSADLLERCPEALCRLANQHRVSNQDETAATLILPQPHWPTAR